MSARVLVVDDDADWIATYQLWLEEEGHQVRGAATAADARRAVAEWRPHVVLVDQRLEGGGGRDVGLSLLRQLADLFPPAQLVVVTAYATREAVERAFREGASDYLEKREILEPLLRIKVRAAARLAARSVDDESAEAQRERLRDAWQAARTEPNAQIKGRRLEETVRILLERVPGFTHARTNLASEAEEIDVIAANRSLDPILRSQGDFVVVECKNWSTSVGVEVISRLRDKVVKRFGRARLGICVSMGGFTAPARAEVLNERRGEVLLLLLDAHDIAAWIEADPVEWLVMRIESAVVAG